MSIGEIILFMKNIRKAYYKGPKSDHFDGLRFFNPWNPQKFPLLEVIRWKMTSKRKQWPNKRQNPQSDSPPRRVVGKPLRISFVGHSTMLIQTESLNILTDPIWSNRASPFKGFGPARYNDPGITFEKLPNIDIILISHNHYDHLDISTIKKIWIRDRPRIIAPLGNDISIQLEDPSIHVDTLDWNQAITFDEKATFYLMPSQHWSRRGFSDRNKALWGAFVISTTSGNIYFCGDSGYEKNIFRKTLERFGSFRFAMLPIGAYEPRWFMEYAHMNPEDAVQAYKDLGEPYTAAIHFETFQLTDEGFDDPSSFLMETCINQGINPQKFRALKPGETWMVPD